jgi:hypothetical protein
MNPASSSICHLIKSLICRKWAVGHLFEYSLKLVVELNWIYLEET